MSNSPKKRKKILIFSEYYLPGYKSGGGMRTIVNIVASLKDKFDFYVVTKDHDGRSDKTPFKNVKINEWNEVQGAKVFYLSKNNVNHSKILELIREVSPDILYSNSYFSAFNVYLLLLKRLGKFNRLTYLISPCGELSEGALEVSFYKKKFFMFLAKSFQFHTGICWKATNETEKKEIEKLKVEAEKIFIAPDLTSRNLHCENGRIEKPEKKPGSVRFVFLSRFSEKKNFKFFLENLRDIQGNVEVDIYAPIDVESYWQECQEIIKKLPQNIKVEPKNPVPHSEVHDTLIKYHFFVMPTLGENFGHAVLEALTAGCALLISNRTPWLNLEQKRIGWDLPLENPAIWKETIQKCVDMEQTEFTELSENSVKFAEDWFKDNRLEEKTVELFETI